MNRQSSPPPRARTSRALHARAVRPCTRTPAACPYRSGIQPSATIRHRSGSSAQSRICCCRLACCSVQRFLILDERGIAAVHHALLDQLRFLDIAGWLNRVQIGRHEFWQWIQIILDRRDRERFDIDDGRDHHVLRPQSHQHWPVNAALTDVVRMVDSARLRARHCIICVSSILTRFSRTSARRHHQTTAI